MDIVTAIWTFLVESVLPYAPYLWPFFTAVIVSAVIGQILRHRLWTKANAAKYRWVAFGRATIPAHPLLAGMFTGYFWRNPCGVPWPVVQSMAYFAVSGVVALVGYLFLDKWVEKKFGIDLDVLFDESIYPSHPEVPTVPDVDVARSESKHDDVD